MLEESHGIKPRVVKEPAIITKTENQVRVFQAPVSCKTSVQLRTPTTKSRPKVQKAARLASILVRLPVIQRTRAMMKITAISFSGRVIFPI